MNARKLRMIFPLLCGGIIAMAAGSCSQNTGADDPLTGPELRFSVVPVSRAAANYPAADYFAVAESVAVIADGMNSTYVYDEGMLVYNSGDEISFPSANQPLERVELTWPVGISYSYDQTAKEAFLTSDIMVCSFTNLMPSEVVPVEFSHVNYKMTFTAGGADTGKKIALLSVGKSTIYQAFCGDADVMDAQLIVPAGTDLTGLPGWLTFENEDGYYMFSIPEYTLPEDGTLNQNITVTIIL